MDMHIIGIKIKSIACVVHLVPPNIFYSYYLTVQTHNSLDFGSKNAFLHLSMKIYILFINTT